MLCLAACGGPAAPDPTLSVTTTSADGAMERGQALFYLNHPLRIDFSRPLDPLSITGDTVRVVDAHGHAVPGALRIGTRSVTFEPHPPLAPSLDDGSLKPDQIYRLEVAGFPRANAVRAADGQVLDRTVVRPFRTMGVDAHRHGLPSPLLPVQRGEERFELRADLLPALRMAAETRRLQLHFTLPVLPPTARPDAFRIRRQSAPSEPMAPSEVRVVSRPEPLDPFPGCTLELLFGDEPQFAPNDVLYVLFDAGEQALRDYRGRPIEIPQKLGGYVRIPVDSGARRALLQIHASTRVPQLHRGEGAQVGFVVTQDRIQPAVYTEAGTGQLGRFTPQQDLRITRGLPFDRGDGVQVSSPDGRFDFESIHIRRGIRVELIAAQDQVVWLRALREIVVEGELLLHVEEPQGATLRPGDQVALARLLESARIALVAGGDVRVTGRIDAPGGVLAPPGGRAASLALVSGGAMQVSGAIPPRTMLAVPPGRRIEGAASDPIPLEVAMTPGLAPGARLTAQAWTEWFRLPLDRQGPVDIVLHGADPGLQVAVQVAAPDPIDGTRPFLDPAVTARPEALPLRGDLLVPRGGFLRLSLQCDLRDGALAGLAGFSVYAR